MVHSVLARSITDACRVCVLAIVAALSVCSGATGQPPEQSADDEIRALDRRSVELLGHLNKHGEAQSLAQKALDIAERASGSASALVAQRLDNLGFTIRIQYRYGEAEALLVRALSIREKLFGADSPDLCQSLTNVGVIQELKRELAAAQHSLSRCLSLRERAFGVDHPTVGHTLHMLAMLYRQAGRSAEAEELSGRAMEILGPEHPALVLAEYESGKRARDHTFFGQFSDYRWTGLRVDAGDDPQRMTLLGEATFNNGLWNLFEVAFARKDGVWKVTGFLPLRIYWKVQ